MSKKLGIVIMAHPERQLWAEELSKKLKAPIVYDRINNVWDTCRRSWLSQVKAKTEYTLVLQDDAIVCRDFYRRAAKLLNEDLVYSFYAGQLMATKIDTALMKGKNFVTSGMIFNEVALCMKTEHIAEMVEFCDRRQATTDQEINRWTRFKRLDIYYPIPSLVDHRDGESIYQRNSEYKTEKSRKAYKYVDRR